MDDSNAWIQTCIRNFGGGINPVNQYSEFAGLPLKTQKEKIGNGVKIFESHGLNPRIFFAPAHTFDENTMEALRQCSEIRIISDTPANNYYYKDDFYFIPQQSGRVRNLPFSLVTFCYHPNKMAEKDFSELESFLSKHRVKFCSVEEIDLKERKFGILDCAIRKLYFARR